MIRRVLPLFVLSFVLLTSCATIPEGVSPQWTEEMFFKNAQEAMDESRYALAAYYYDVYLVRFPENQQRKIAAEYEKAFIHYKTGNYKKAEDGYKTIISRYDESPYAMLFPPRFKQLCEIGLENIAYRRATQNKVFWRIREKSWADEQGESLTDDTGETG